MSDRPFLSMVMIARDEEENVARCFSSFWDDVDEVVLVDTGSTDGTVAAAEAFVGQHGDPGKLVVGRFEWCDDFAAARNYADSLATGVWRSWADLDDEVVGLGQLRKTAEDAGPEITTIYCPYEYAVDDDGHCFCELVRERLVRADAGTTWIGAIHECQAGPGVMWRVGKDVARWVHRRAKADTQGRNERLLLKWLEREPDNPRALQYMGSELLGARKQEEHEDGTTSDELDLTRIEESVPYFQKFLSLGGQPSDVRAQTVRRLAMALIALGRLEDAQMVTVPMLAECPSWPDNSLTLAELAHSDGDWQKAIEFATDVVNKGMPNTVLIINPQDYLLKPHVIIASAKAAMGQLEEACQIAERVLTVDETYMGMKEQLAGWRNDLVRETAGTTWANCAQMLVQNDEPEKALQLLGTVPYFSSDHPLVIKARILTDLALRAPYRVDQVGDSARGRFLERGLREQAENPELVEEPALMEAA